MTQAILSYPELAPAAFQGLLQLSLALKKGTLPAQLLELVLLRVSQINGCAYCIDMHARELSEGGMSQRHLNNVAGWREAPFFSARERAALAFAEAANGLPQDRLPESVVEEARTVFSDVEVAELAFAVATIRAWNLLNVTFRNPVPESV